jgi:transposase
MSGHRAPSDIQRFVTLLNVGKQKLRVECERCSAMFVKDVHVVRRNEAYQTGGFSDSLLVME